MEMAGTIHRESCNRPFSSSVLEALQQAVADKNRMENMELTPKRCPTVRHYVEVLGSRGVRAEPLSLALQCDVFRSRHTIPALCLVGCGLCLLELCSRVVSSLNLTAL